MRRPILKRGRRLRHRAARRLGVRGAFPFRAAEDLPDLGSPAGTEQVQSPDRSAASDELCNPVLAARNTSAISDRWGNPEADHRQAAERHEHMAETHERAATFWDHRGRAEYAEIQRGLADHERRAAELERRWTQVMNMAALPDRVLGAAERAKNLTRRNAERLSSVLRGTAAELERSAAIAEEHARQQERAGWGDDAAEEREAAGRFREYAQRARSQAEDWLELSTRPP